MQVAVDHDMLVLAELNPDVIVATESDVRFGQVEQLVDRAAITLGSSGAITACAAAALGMRVALCGVIGDDAAGAMTVELLEAHGVDVSGVIRRELAATGMTVVLTRNSGDRALLTFPGTMGDLRAEDVPSGLLDHARHVHVSSYYLQTGIRQGLAELFDSCRSAGRTTSLDTGWDPDERWVSVLDALHAVDVLLPNVEECTRIGEAAGLDGGVLDVARALHRSSGATIALKLGAEGAAVVSADATSRIHTTPVVPVDTTGAGDNFNAGYLAAMLDGATPSESAARAAACGAISVQGFGGTGRLPGHDEAVALAATYRIEDGR